MSAEVKGQDASNSRRASEKRGFDFVLEADPGPDHGYVGAGPIAIFADKVSKAEWDRFYAAIRSQGPEKLDNPQDPQRPIKVRRRAIDMAIARARSDKRLSHAAFRVFEGVASCCKWAHRYHYQAMEVLSFNTSLNPANNNVARYVDQAVKLGYLAEIYVPSGIGGRAKRYLTVICTAADRTGQTLADIAIAARQQKVRGADENLTELAGNHAGESDLRPEDAIGASKRNPDVLPTDASSPIRNGYVSIRNGYGSKRNLDALTQEILLKDTKGGEEIPPSLSGEVKASTFPKEKEEPPLAPRLAECDMQLNGEVRVGLSLAAYAIHRTWWPGLDAAQADRMLDAQFEALDGRDPAKLEGIIIALNGDYEAGNVKAPGKVMTHRIARANTRSAAGTDKGQRFKPTEYLGSVGYGHKVTGADGNDILDAVRGSGHDTVRRLIREVCGRWIGPNGKNKSTHHVVEEVIRQLSGNAAGRPTAATPIESINIPKSIEGAKDKAAKLAALRQQMSHANAHVKSANGADKGAGK